MDSLPPSMASQPGDRHVLAGEWEYVDGGAVRLTLDEQGNGHYLWKDGRFETHTLIGHTWHGMWFQKENDREGGCTVEFSPDFSEGEGHWWISRIGADQAPMQKSGTFHLSKKTALTGSLMEGVSGRLFSADWAAPKTDTVLYLHGRNAMLQHTLKRADSVDSARA